jgi:CubicO group peptidase (beta-lactamase class C family)
VRLLKYLCASLLIGAATVGILRLLAKPAFAKGVAQANTYDTLDAYIERQMAQLNIPGVSLAVVEGDRIVHLRGFGKARPGGEAPTPQTPFLLGSLTKSFTALAVMQLVEAGQIELDAPVQRYLPWFRVADPQAAAQMTVRHLLNQTSGLPQLPGMLNLANFDSSPNATEQQARALSTLELARPVGAAFEYSNLNYNLLGLIVEAASGESYADYLQAHLFDPLAMTHSFTTQAAAKADGLAVGHRYWFGWPVAVPDLPMPQGSLPSGQLIAGAEDMGHYLIAHLNGGRYDATQLLSSAGITELHRGVVTADQMGVSMGQYGMGWFDQVIDQTRIGWHHGQVPDFFAYMALLPAQQQGLVLLVNADQSLMNLALVDVGMGAAQQLAGASPPPLPFGFMPWALRALLLMPVLQLIGVVTTLRHLRRWRRDPNSRPRGGRLWGRHILLPLIANLLFAAPLVGLLSSGMLPFMRLFMADLAWLALISGAFALGWSGLRAGLILRMRRTPAAPPVVRAVSVGR